MYKSKQRSEAQVGGKRKDEEQDEQGGGGKRTKKDETPSKKLSGAAKKAKDAITKSTVTYDMIGGLTLTLTLSVT